MTYQIHTFTITEIVKRAMLEHKTNKEVLAEVKRLIPTSSTTLTTIQWYRKTFIKKGLDIPKARELKHDDWLD